MQALKYEAPHMCAKLACKEEVEEPQGVAAPKSLQQEPMRSERAPDAQKLFGG
jgi:hypothetical protein